MHAEGMIVKMPVTVAADAGAAPSEGVAQPNIEYQLRLEEPRPAAGEPPADVTEVGMNRLVGRPIRLEHTGKFSCVRCGRSVDKLFGEGYCYP